MGNTISLFATFEGGEGTGKSTQIKLLQANLETAGYLVLLLREPGGTTIGEHIRSILLDPSNGEMDPITELLLYEAARSQIVQERIKPALAAGMVVICDRFYDSTTAYQGYARGLDLDRIDALNMTATAGLRPDLTIVLDIDVKTGLNRATVGGADRLEAEDLGFHERVRNGFLAIARNEPERAKVVDATGTVEEVHQRIMTYFRERLQMESERS